MGTAFIGICVAISFTVIFVILLLSDSRSWTKFLLSVGVCLLFGGLGG